MASPDGTGAPSTATTGHHQGSPALAPFQVGYTTWLSRPSLRTRKPANVSPMDRIDRLSDTTARTATTNSVSPYRRRWIGEIVDGSVVTGASTRHAGQESRSVADDRHRQRPPYVPQCTALGSDG